MFDRSAAVKLQLRDAKGRFIKMGSHVKWTSLSSGKDVSGIVRGEDGNNVLIEFQHGGKPYTIHVPHTKLNVINEKATLDPAYVQKMGGHIVTPDINDPGVTPGHATGTPAAPAGPIKNFTTLSTNETYYRIGSADGEKINTSVADLKIGDEVMPIATSGPFQKSPYNAKANGTSANIQKFGPGLGKVVGIKDGAYVTIQDANNKQWHVSISHFVLKRDHNTERAVLSAQKLEASTIHAGKTPPSLPWIDSLKSENAPAAPQPATPSTPDEPDMPLSDHIDAADMPVGSKIPLGGEQGSATKTGDNKWVNDKTGTQFDDKSAEHIIKTPAPEKIAADPDQHVGPAHADQVAEEKAADAPADPATSTPEVGAVVGNYELLANLSKGSKVGTVDKTPILTNVGDLKVGDKVYAIGKDKATYNAVSKPKSIVIANDKPLATVTDVADWSITVKDDKGKAYDIHKGHYVAQQSDQIDHLLAGTTPDPSTVAPTPAADAAPDQGHITKLPSTSGYATFSEIAGSNPKVADAVPGTVVAPLNKYAQMSAWRFVKNADGSWGTFKEGKFSKTVLAESLPNTFAGKFNVWVEKPEEAKAPFVPTPLKLAPEHIVKSDEKDNIFGDHFSAMDFNASGNADEFKAGDKIFFGAGHFAATVTEVVPATDTHRGYLNVTRDNPSAGGFSKSGHTNSSIYANGVTSAFTPNGKPVPETKPSYDASKFSEPHFVEAGKLKVGDVIQANNALRLRVDSISPYSDAHSADDLEIAYSIAEGTTAHKAKIGNSWGKNYHNSKDQLTTFVAKDSAPDVPSDVPAESAPESASSDLGDNFSELPPMSTYQKGDVAALKDGSLAPWIGKGQITLEDGSKVMGNKFAVDGVEKGVAGKDIKSSYRPKSLVVHAPSDHPFGPDAQGYNFDLSKPNNENFKAGDLVVYGKDKNQGKIFSVNPTNILVEKLNSDKTVNGTATIVAGQVHGKYIQPKSASKGKAPGFGMLSAKQKLDAAEKMYGTGSKEHKKAQEMFGKDAAAEVPAAAPAAEAPATPEAPAAPEAPVVAPTASTVDATQQTFPDKGKSIKDSTGAEVKANDMIHFAGKGVGKVKIVLPSTDSVKVVYPDGKEMVHKFNKITKVEGDAPKIDALPSDLKVGDSGVDPNTHTAFIVGANNTLLHKGDTVTHSSGDKGTVAAIYKGEKTVKVTWDDGHTTGPKKSSQLEGTAKTEPAAPEAGKYVSAWGTVHDEKPEMEQATVRPYSSQDEEALVNFKDNFMEIGEHLRGSAEHAFPNAGEIIHGLDDLIGKSKLTEDLTAYRGFVTLDPKVIESLKPGTLMYEKSFTSTSLDMNIALDALELGPLVEAPKNHAPGMAPPEVEHSVIVKFELPKGSYGHQINYEGLSNKTYKQDAHEKEVILPRAFNYEIKEVSDGTDAQGRPLKTVTVTAVHKSGASDQEGPGMHAVEANAEVGSKPFKILEDPGADGDGFHESGPWGHFGASGVMVEAPDPETGEPRYLIVENGDLHEEQNRGLWQLPGGAANGNENPYQAAAREMHEELEVDPATIASFEHAGDVAFENGKGWAYTNIGAKAPKQFDMKLDGYETSGAKWVSADELRKMRDDNQLLPAFGHNIDNLLAVYTPKEDAKSPEAATDVDAPELAPETAPDINAKPLSIKDFTKINGKYSGGSNDGAFYTDKDGTEYYLKYNMHEGHARDEILASKIYQSLGVNAANQEMLDMGDGKIGVASKMIATDGHDSNIHLNEPEYRKEAQADFAIDVLLANWDVAGIGNNNLLTDANGKPLRLDPGAALRFRAQGAAKSDFGPSAKEWDFLRTGANSESSSIKPTAKLFGDMTDEQLKESASKLHELTDDKIDSIVDSVGYDKKDGDFLKATLKARRDDILDRAGVKNTNNEGAPDGAGQTAGEDGTTHEAGPEAGKQVPVDSGSGTDLHAAEEGGTEGDHQVGDILSGEEIGKLPIGSKVEMQKASHTTLTKTSETEWHKDGDPQPFMQGFLDQNGADWKVLDLPAAAAEASAPQKDLSTTPLPDLQTGTTITPTKGNWFFKKAEDGMWVSHKKDTKKAGLSSFNDVDMKSYLGGPTGEHTVEAPIAEVPKPDWDGKTFADFGKDKVNELPVGTKLLKDSNLHYFIKRESGMWQAHNVSDDTEMPNKLATAEQMMGMPDKHAESYTLQAPEDTPTTPDASAGVPASTLGQKAIEDLPVGSKINKADGGYLLKENTGWTTKKADGTDDTIYEMDADDVNYLVEGHPAKFTTVESAAAPEELPGKPIGEYTKTDIEEFPVGTKVFRKNGNYVEKTGDGVFQQKKPDGTKLFQFTYNTTDVSNMMTNHSENFSHVELGEATAPEEKALRAPVTEHLPSPSADELDALPEGTILVSDEMSKWTWTKKSDGTWEEKAPNGTLYTQGSEWVADGADFTATMPKGYKAPAKDAAPATATTPAASTLQAPSEDELDALPDGTALTEDSMPGYQWIKDGEEWKAITPMGGDHHLPSSSLADGSTYNLAAPGTTTALDAPETDVKVGDDVKPETLLTLPIGTVFHGVGSKDWEFKKVSDTQVVFTSHPHGTKYGIQSMVDSAKGTDVKYTIADLPSDAAPVSPAAVTTQSGPSVKGKDGKDIFAGDDISWESKGILGKAIEVDAAAGRVRMLYPDGSMKWYMASKMVKQGSGSPKSVSKPAAKVGGDPSSPLYGTPAPTYKAPATTPEPIYLPDGFIEEIEKRYADKLNPSWSKPSPQQSFYWTKVEAFQASGDLAALETLHEKLYISDEMFQKAKDHAAASATSIAPIKAANAKVTAEALKKHNEDLVAWEEANGVVKGNAITSSFPQLASAEWDKASGFITNADGTQSADWSKATAGSYSVDSILKSINSDENLAAHGISAMIDSTSIMDSNVRFTKVVMPDGTTRIQAKFEVSEASRQGILDTMQKSSSIKIQNKVSVGQTEFGGVGDLAKYDPKVGNVEGITSPSDYYGKTYSIDSSGTHIQFTAGDQDKSYGEFSNNAEALRSLAAITLPENATTADLEKALKAMGIADAHPSPKESVDHHKMKRLVGFFDGFIGERNTKFEDDPQSLKLAAEKILAEKGYSLEDFRLVMTENGFMNFRLPNALRDKLTNESGIKALIHTNMDWIPQGEEKGNFNMYQWDASKHNVDRIVKKYAGGAKGYLPTAKRMLEGDDAKGMSPLPDIKSGGSRYLFMSPAKSQSKINEYSASESGIVAHPSIAFQYLTNYGNSEDNMSGLREEGATLVDQMKMKQSPYEAMIYNGLSIADSWYSITNAKQKPTIIAALKAANVHEVNGIPVESFFVVPGVDPIPEWKEPNPELGL